MDIRSAVRKGAHIFLYFGLAMLENNVRYFVDSVEFPNETSYNL